MAPKIVSFHDALNDTAEVRRHLLIGNGFSIALFPDRFRYGSLLEQANFDQIPEARKAFDVLATTDFEIVVDALKKSVALLPLYSLDVDTRTKMAEHAEALKELLVHAIAGRHPERPSDVTEAQYKSARSFFANFVGDSRELEIGGKTKDLRGNIYTLNYDLLLYWTLLHDQVVNWSVEDPLEFTFEDTEPLEHDDGFRAPKDDPEAAYVTWDAEGTSSDSQNIHFLHGALHLFDYGSELQKRCWERGGNIPLIDQIREALNSGKFPLFVSEGSSAAKMDRIRHNGYLQRSLRSFAAICRVRDASLFVLGHSLADNDKHVLRQIERGKISRLYVSFHGDVHSPENQSLITKALAIGTARSEASSLQVAFFDSDLAKVWG
jgi:hypothetical protein